MRVTLRTQFDFGHDCVAVANSDCLIETNRLLVHGVDETGMQSCSTSSEQILIQLSPSHRGQ
jgi:hypothetical protein